MKKILSVTIMITFIFCSCGENLSSTIPKISYDDIEYEESVFNYDDTEFNINIIDCIPDKQTAINVATSIFIAKLDCESHYEDYKVMHVEHDKKDKIWYVHFGLDSPEAYGWSYSIALSEENGEVLKIWVGE